MSEFDDILSKNEITTLASIVQVGDATYRELMEDKQPMFGHPYFDDTRGRIRTKLVQMQCELESHDPNVPFEFKQREFSDKHVIPEICNKNMIIHIARSTSMNSLPYASRYKIDLANNNRPLCRQMMFDMYKDPIFYGPEPYYGLLVFGGEDATFSALQFPAPGFKEIAELIEIPQISILKKDEKEVEQFERKKAVLKKEFLAHGTEEKVL